MNATGWSRGLEVTSCGTGVVSHAGLVLLRELAGLTGLTAGLSAMLLSPQGRDDRGRVLADLACAIADGARGDQRFPGDGRPAGAVRSGCVGPDCVACAEGGRGRRGPCPPQGHRRGEQGAAARVGAGRAAAACPDRGPGPEGVTCIRLDATVVQAHSDKELAEANFKGYGHHPLLAACDNTGEPLA